MLRQKLKEKVFYHVEDTVAKTVACREIQEQIVPPEHDRVMFHDLDVEEELPF